MSEGPASILVELVCYWSIPHPQSLHGHSPLRCSNCYDLAEPGFEDAWEELQREEFVQVQSLDPEIPYAEDVAEDLAPANDGMHEEVGAICWKCGHWFGIPKHVFDELERQDRFKLCSSCRVNGRT